MDTINWIGNIYEIRHIKRGSDLTIRYKEITPYTSS